MSTMTCPVIHPTKMNFKRLWEQAREIWREGKTHTIIVFETMEGYNGYRKQSSL
jgi:hypothetical protein